MLSVVFHNKTLLKACHFQGSSTKEICVCLCGHVYAFHTCISTADASIVCEHA